jgi:hypothetical protein
MAPFGDMKQLFWADRQNFRMVVNGFEFDFWLHLRVPHVTNATEAWNLMSWLLGVRTSFKVVSLWRITLNTKTWIRMVQLSGFRTAWQPKSCAAFRFPCATISMLKLNYFFKVNQVTCSVLYQVLYDVPRFLGWTLNLELPLLSLKGRLWFWFSKSGSTAGLWEARHLPVAPFFCHLSLLVRNPYGLPVRQPISALLRLCTCNIAGPLLFG